MMQRELESGTESMEEENNRQDLSYKEPVIYCCVIASKVSDLKQQTIYNLSLCGSEIWEQLTWVVRVQGLS